MNKTTLQFRRALCYALCFLFLLSAVACSPATPAEPSPTPTEVTPTEEPDTGLLVFEKGNAPIPVVRPDVNEDDAIAMSLSVKKAITALAGTDCPIDTDWVKRGTEPPTTPEILIGKTNRPESTQALEGIENGGIITVINDKLVINGTSETYLKMAVNAFLSAYLSESQTKLTYTMIQTQIIRLNGEASFTDNEMEIDINDPTWGGAQYITKLYTEGYGRAPSAEEYLDYYEYVNKYGCTQDTLADLAKKQFSDKAFTELALNDREGAFAVYRAVLNRDPTEAEIAAFSVGDAAKVAVELASGKEFGKMVSAINQGNYGWGSNNQTAYTGTAVYTSAEVNEMLQNANVVELPRGALVLCTEAVNLSGGKTLRTEGSPASSLQMARFLRVQAGGWAVVELNGDGNTLESVWLDGNRSKVGICDGGNCWVCGSNCTVKGCKMSDTAASTNMACVAIFTGVSILDNLITCYTSNNHTNWTDGITFQSRGRIAGNTIIDATDVAVVVFREWNGDPQDSVIENNTAISAGNSCFAAYHTDAWMDEGQMRFDGCTFRNNAAWTSMKTHFNIVLSLASTAWHYNGNVAAGAAAYNNYTPEGLYAVCGIGIAVDSMKNAQIHGNNLHVYIADVEGRFGTHLIACNQTDFPADCQAGYDDCALHDDTGSYIGCRENVMGPVWTLREGFISETNYPAD